MTFKPGDLVGGRFELKTMLGKGGNGTVWQAIADWETLYTEYLDAGGQPMEFEDRRGQMLRILPEGIRRDVFRRLNDFKTIADLKEWIQEQLELEKDWDAADYGAPRAPTVGLLDPDGDESLASSEGPTAEDMEALWALTPESPPAEVMAVQRRFQKFQNRYPAKTRAGPTRGPGGQFTPSGADGK